MTDIRRISLSDIIHALEYCVDDSDCDGTCDLNTGQKCQGCSAAQALNEAAEILWAAVEVSDSAE